MLTQYLETICEKLNISPLPDRLQTTYWEAIAKHCGVDVDALPDRLITTYIGAILKVNGVSDLPDNLMTTHLEALAGVYGVSDLPDRLINTYLEAIADNWSEDSGDNVTEIVFEVTGDEAFTFSSASRAVYFNNPAIKGLNKSDIIGAECDLFTYSNVDTLADMKDREFIFNASNGITTGNVSFKDVNVFDSAASAADWFRMQGMFGFPVTITCYVKAGGN